MGDRLVRGAVARASNAGRARDFAGVRKTPLRNAMYRVMVCPSLAKFVVSALATCISCILPLLPFMAIMFLLRLPDHLVVTPPPRQTGGAGTEFSVGSRPQGGLNFLE